LIPSTETKSHTAGLVREKVKREIAVKVNESEVESSTQRRWGPKYQYISSSPGGEGRCGGAGVVTGAAAGRSVGT
jgi:hypothetical protein